MKVLLSLLLAAMAAAPSTRPAAPTIAPVAPPPAVFDTTATYRERVDEIHTAILVEAGFFQSPNIDPVIGPWSNIVVLHIDTSTTMYDLHGLLAVQPVDQKPTCVDLVYEGDPSNPSTLESCWLDKKKIKRQVKTNCSKLGAFTCANVHKEQCDAMETVFPPHPTEPTCP